MFTERVSQFAKGKPRTLLHGVGINDAPYVTAYKQEGKLLTCPYYAKWSAVITRCFSPTFLKQRPTYGQCTLEESWKRFSSFKTWMQTQDWVSKHLDKDLLLQGNKHYGPDTCLFISPALNNLLCLRKNHRGAFPLGVSRMTVKGYDYFVAACSFYGKQTRLGYFKTIEEAAYKYKEAKLNYIMELANAEKDPRIRQALLNLF